jgi:hypothetical protein
MNKFTFLSCSLLLISIMSLGQQRYKTKSDEQANITLTFKN